MASQGLSHCLLDVIPICMYVCMYFYLRNRARQMASGSCHLLIPQLPTAKPETQQTELLLGLQQFYMHKKLGSGGRAGNGMQTLQHEPWVSSLATCLLGFNSLCVCDSGLTCPIKEAESSHLCQEHNPLP